MTEALEATYLTFWHMKTQPVIRIELEIPAERFQSMIDVIGPPPVPGESKHVAIVLLKENSNAHEI